jgi:formylglycine-generating enzyme required for sulfatase activity
VHKDHKIDEILAPTGDCPVLSVTWYEAAEYCNWLSKEEGLSPDQWCYLPNQPGKYADGMKMAPNYLHRTGYRLPTEAEWEYACRAGAVTDFSWGQTEDLLGKYAWHFFNSSERSHPVGTLKPNDLGLHDMHGNAWEWTQDAYRVYVKDKAGNATDDVEDMSSLSAIDSRVLRGGSFFFQAVDARSANRLSYVPSNRLNNVGFRVARTVRDE